MMKIINKHINIVWSQCVTKMAWALDKLPKENLI